MFLLEFSAFIGSFNTFSAHGNLEVSNGVIQTFMIKVRNHMPQSFVHMDDQSFLSACHWLVISLGFLNYFISHVSFVLDVGWRLLLIFPPSHFDIFFMILETDLNWWGTILSCCSKTMIACPMCFFIRVYQNLTYVFYLKNSNSLSNFFLLVVTD